MQELRSSVRFPIKLPVSVSTEGAPHEAQTTDISAGGVLFEVDRDMTVGSSVTFRIAMPAAVLGTPKDVVVSCAGRVVRCTDSDGRKSVAAVIDEYHFERPEVAVAE
jgi:PilZ domain